MPCDTFVALPTATSDSSVLFAKNSDRPVNEEHEIVFLQRASHQPNENVRMTYISIPNVPQTFAAILCKPKWMEGAEMGVNEFGVVIGNQAMYSSKVPYHTSNDTLTGMDAVRLALERSRTAREAVDVITGLLQSHPFGGCCTHGTAANKMYYHNGFLIADYSDAWVLETVGSEYWAALQIKSGVYSLSNAYSIRDTFTLASDSVKKLKEANPSTFDFSQHMSDFLYTTFGRGRIRRQTTQCLMETDTGALTVQKMSQILRHSAGQPTAREYDPLNTGLFTFEVCCDAAFGPVRFSQCTGSMIVHLNPLTKTPTVFVTATSGVKLSLFKPIWIDCTLDVNQRQREPINNSKSTDDCIHYTDDSLWWRHEQFHRMMLLLLHTTNGREANGQSLMEDFEREREKLESEFINSALQLSMKSLDNNHQNERATLSHKAFEEAESLCQRFISEQTAANQKKEISDSFPMYILNVYQWLLWSRESKMPSQLQNAFQTELQSAIARNRQPIAAVIVILLALLCYCYWWWLH